MPLPFSARPLGRLLIACWAGLLTGCPALFPELATPIREIPKATALEPPPPQDLLYLRFQKAWIPIRTRDGREWSGGAPDPYAVLLVDRKELFRTPLQSRTHEPTWPDAVKANYRVKPGSQVVVELWDDSTFQEHPICMKEIEDLHASAMIGTVDLVCDAGAKISLIVEPAHAKFGVGMWYEMRSGAIYITRVLEESPAARAGLRAGQRVLSVQSREISHLDEGQIRSIINANLSTGLVMTVLEQSGETRTAPVKEGPIYPLVGEEIPLD